MTTYQPEYKPETSYQAQPLVGPTEPTYNGSGLGAEGGDISRMEARDLKLKREIRILKICQRVASLLLSITLTATMAYTLSRYYSTRNTTVNGQSPWPVGTVLWPSIMLFAISAIAFLLYSAIMVSYCISGVKAANTMSTIASFFTVTFGLMKFVAWAVTSALYGVWGNGETAIRGWSCGGSDSLSPPVQAVVNFDRICKSNTGSFHLTYIVAIVEAFSLVVWIWMARRYFSKRRTLKARKDSERVAF